MKKVQFATINELVEYLKNNDLEPMPEDMMAELNQIFSKLKGHGKIVLQFEDDEDENGNDDLDDLLEEVAETPANQGQFEGTPQATIDMTEGMGIEEKFEYYNSCQRGIIDQLMSERDNYKDLYEHEIQRHHECHEKTADMMAGLLTKHEVVSWARAKYMAAQEKLPKHARVLWKDMPEALQPLVLQEAAAELTEFYKLNAE